MIKRKIKERYHNDGKRDSFFQWSYNYKGDRLNKDIKKEKFKKYFMKLIETNHQINMTTDHSVSSNNSFKSHLNAKGFSMSLKLKQLCKSRWSCLSVSYKGDVNV